MGASSSTFTKAPSQKNRTEYTYTIRKEFSQLTKYTGGPQLKDVVTALLQKKHGSIGYLLLVLDEECETVSKHPETFLSKIQSILTAHITKNDKSTELEMSPTTATTGESSASSPLASLQSCIEMLEGLAQNVKMFQGCQAKFATLPPPAAGASSSSTQFHLGTLLLNLLNRRVTTPEDKLQSRLETAIIQLTDALLSQPDPEKRPSLDARDKEGRTPLLTLIRHDRSSSIRQAHLPALLLLRKHGADVNTRTSKGHTLLSSFFHHLTPTSLEVLIRWLQTESDLTIFSTEDTHSFYHDTTAAKQEELKNMYNTCLEIGCEMLKAVVAIQEAHGREKKKEEGKIGNNVAASSSLDALTAVASVSESSPSAAASSSQPASSSSSSSSSSSTFIMPSFFPNFLISTLESLPNRLLSHSILLRYRAIQERPYSPGDSCGGEDIARVTNELIDVMENGSQCIPPKSINLSEMDSDGVSLLLCIIRLPTDLLLLKFTPHSSTFLQHLSQIKQETFLVSLPPSLALSAGGVSFDISSASGVGTNPEYRLFEMLVMRHQPNGQDDLIYSVYHTILTSLSSPFPSQRFNTSSRGWILFHALFHHGFTARFYYSLAQKSFSPHLRDSPHARYFPEPRKLKHRHVIGILRVLEEFGVYGTSEKADSSPLSSAAAIFSSPIHPLAGDYYTYFLRRCSTEDLKEWFCVLREEKEWLTTDILWPTRTDWFPVKRSKNVLVWAKECKEVMKEEMKVWKDLHLPRLRIDLSEHLLPDLADVVLSFFPLEKTTINIAEEWDESVPEPQFGLRW